MAKLDFVKGLITHQLINIPGWKTDKKIVVIESDDWGSIRMPSRQTYDKLLKSGLRVDLDPYCRFDNIANSSDLTALFEILNSVKDKNGNPACITANSVMANPDFERIKQSGFGKYHYELFTETMKKVPYEDVFHLWKQGIAEGFFKPQFHGREHLNVSKWMQMLRSGDPSTLIAFHEKVFGVASLGASNMKYGYMGAFDSAFPEDVNNYCEIIESGLRHFRGLFGYASESFIATTYTWSPQIEECLSNNGIRYLQGMISQRVPLDDGGRFTYKKTNYQGKRNALGQIYLMRNAYFEPSQVKNKAQVLDDCLNRIGIAFLWHKAAVISSHRLNYIGSIETRNRDENIVLFKKLLTSIVKRWPDVEFLSSDELGKLIESSK